jgi:beta-N-acetylhexosaminidase
MAGARPGAAATLAAVIAVAALAAGCSSPAPPPPPPPAGANSPAPPPASPASPSPGTGSSSAAAAQELQGPAATPTSAQLTALRRESGVIGRLSTAQQAGQRVIYSYSGTTPPQSLLTEVSRGLVGGVIFFSFNATSQAQLTGAIRQLDQANASQDNPARDYPLLLVTDQEGGMVRRLPWAGPQLSHRQIGEASSPAATATTAGTQAAQGLRAVGMNANLAPVLDVYRQPGDFDDQAGRSFSTNPAVVGSAGAAFTRGQQGGGVAATLKHFPGLGPAATTQNTDNEPVVINEPAATLRSVDEAPYRDAVKAGAKLAMVSWATYPALEQRRLPAGLSPPIVQGELQRRVGFSGTTITDALGAGALRAYGSLPNKTMLAARAGMDALLCTATQPLPGEQCRAGLQDGYNDGALPPMAFRGQLAQLLSLRAGLRHQ